MARNESFSDVLGPLIGGLVALGIGVVIIFGVVRNIKKWKSMGTAPTVAKKQDQNTGDERRPRDSGTVSNPNPSGMGGNPSGSPVSSTLMPGLRETKATGGFMAQNKYREYRSDGAILVGFDVGFGRVFNTDVIAYLRPIWLTARGEEYGAAYGRTSGPTTTVKAKSGYAVSGIVIAGGGALEGFCLTFMRIGTKSLVANDAYVSDWYGERTRRPGPEAMRSGDGGFVVGFYGSRFDDRRGNNFDDGGAIATIGLVLWVRD